MGSIKKQPTVETGTRTATCTDGQSDEYATFTKALKKVLTVSHEDMQKKMKSVSARASRAKH